MSQDTTLCCVRQALDVDQALVEHERLVHWVVHQQWLGELSYVAAVQAGRLALWRAVQGYDAQRGVAFSSYAVPTIRRAVWQAVAAAQPLAGEVLCDQPPQTVAEPERTVWGQLVAATVRGLVAQLPERLRTVIVAHYGLADAPPQTFAAIGQDLGVTRQRVQQLHVEALRWLAQPAHSLALRQLLERNTAADYRDFLAQQRRWLRRRRSR